MSNWVYTEINNSENKLFANLQSCIFFRLSAVGNTCEVSASKFISNFSNRTIGMGILLLP